MIHKNQHCVFSPSLLNTRINVRKSKQIFPYSDATANLFSFAPQSCLQCQQVEPALAPRIATLLPRYPKLSEN
jgi:hypothetical protein